MWTVLLFWNCQVRYQWFFELNFRIAWTMGHFYRPRQVVKVGHRLYVALKLPKIVSHFNAWLAIGTYCSRFNWFVFYINYACIEFSKEAQVGRAGMGVHSEWKAAHISECMKQKDSQNLPVLCCFSLLLSWAVFYSLWIHTASSHASTLWLNDVSLYAMLAGILRA